MAIPPAPHIDWGNFRKIIKGIKRGNNKGESAWVLELLLFSALGRSALPAPSTSQLPPALLLLTLAAFAVTNSPCSGSAFPSCSQPHVEEPGRAAVPAPAQRGSHRAGGAVPHAEQLQISLSFFSKERPPDANISSRAFPSRTYLAADFMWVFFAWLFA